MNLDSPLFLYKPEYLRATMHRAWEAKQATEPSMLLFVPVNDV